MSVVCRGITFYNGGLVAASIAVPLLYTPKTLFSFLPPGTTYRAFELNTVSTASELRPDAFIAKSKIQCFVEIALVFLVFFVQGAWPVPDVNEPYYLTKSIHYWNPDYIANDFFLDSADTHTVFYFTFGWLTLFLPPLAVAWLGRLLTWCLLSYAWRRLSLAVLPRRWWAIITASLFLCLLDRCHLAGEWVVGGIEAKGFAYVFVFLGIERLVRNRWNFAWLCFGAAALFHVIVGGWAVVAAVIAWLIMGASRPKLVSMWPGLLGGGLLSLPALLPSIRLTWGIDPQVVSQANQIYVFERLGHHLNPCALPTWFIARFLMLTALWLCIWIAAKIALAKPFAASQQISFDTNLRLHSFVAGSLTIALVGAIIGILGQNNPEWSAGLLRFYWFRMSDVVVPLGVSLGGCSLIASALSERPAAGRRWLALATVIVAIHFGYLATLRAVQSVPRADRLANYECWRHACGWIAGPQNIPPGSRFLTPRMSQTFKWYTGHGEVLTWKDVPQDARSLAEWWRRMKDIYTHPDQPDDLCWYPSLASQGEQRIKAICKRYEADYVITTAKPGLDFTVVYKNPAYVVYQID